MAFVFGFILWVVLSIIGRMFPTVELTSLSYLSSGYYDTLSDVLAVNFIPAYIYELVKIVAMYFTVHYVTKFKLNLQ